MAKELKRLPPDHYNVWLTTYNVANAAKDRPFLKNREFEYLILGKLFTYLHYKTEQKKTHSPTATTITTSTTTTSTINNNPLHIHR